MKEGLKTVFHSEVGLEIAEFITDDYELKIRFSSLHKFSENEINIIAALLR